MVIPGFILAMSIFLSSFSFPFAADEHVLGGKFVGPEQNQNGRVDNMNARNAITERKTIENWRGADAVYSLILRNRTSRIKPGGKVEIEAFLSGYGMPKKNKLYIQLSSLYVLDREDPGDITFCIGFAVNKTTGETSPVAGEKYIKTHKLTPFGAVVILNEGYFSELPGEKTESLRRPDLEIPRVMSEQVFEGHPPLLLKINTSKNAPAGDYDASFTLTYGSEQDLRQDLKSVQFHITSRWERIQGWIVPTGVIIAFISLLITAIGTIARLSR